MPSAKKSAAATAAQRRSTAKMPVEFTAAEFLDTHTNVFSQPSYAAELIAKQIVDIVIDSGAQKLYDNYILSKVADHTADSMMSLMNQLISVEFRRNDNLFNDHSEMKEEHVAKNDYDAHSAYAINVDRKQVFLPEEPIDEIPVEPVAPSRTAKNFLTTKSRLRGTSTGGEVTQELTKTQKKKLLDDMLVPLEQAALSEVEKQEKKEEAQMRQTYMNQLRDEKKQREIDIQQAIQDRKQQAIRAKKLKELEQKTFTYDYDGKPLFLAKKKKGDENNNNARDEARLSQTNAFRNASDSDGTTTYRTTALRKSSADSRSAMDEALRKKMQNIPIEPAVEVPVNQRYLNKVKGTVQYRLPGSQSVTQSQNQSLSAQQQQQQSVRFNKKNDVPEEVYTNGNMRQTSMIPYLTVREGVKFTEMQNGNEVTKMPSTAGGVMDKTRRTNQMSKSEYFKMIDDPKLRLVDPSIQQQLNNSLFDSRSELNQRDGDVSDFKRQRIKSLFVGESSHSNNNTAHVNDSVMLDEANPSAIGYDIGFDPIVIRDSTQLNARVPSASNNSAGINKHNNLNLNYFKNYVPSSHLAAAKTVGGVATGNTVVTNGNAPTMKQRSTTLQYEQNSNQPVLPVLSVYQQKKHAGTLSQQEQRGQSAGEKLRQRSKSHHGKREQQETQDQQQQQQQQVVEQSKKATAGVLQEIQVKSANNKPPVSGGTSVRAPSNKATRLSPKRRPMPSTGAELKDKDGNNVTFYNNQSIVELLVTQ